MELATRFVAIRPDTRGFRKELQDDTEQDVKAVGAKLGGILAGGAFLAGAKKATDAASQLQQAVGGTEAVFGEAQQAVEDFAKGAAESAGLSERAARELTSSLGGLLKGFGFTENEAADLSITLAKLGADLAATFGGSPEEAVQALGAALRGETDPLERFGIALNQTAVNAKAVELGLAASASSVDANAKAQATLALITERSADAQGQFARELDTAAGQAAVAAAKAENSAADLGENLLPIYTKIAETVGRVADVFGSLPEPVQTAVIALAGIVALTGPVKLAAEAIGSLATIARTGLTKGLDAGAKGAYTLAGNIGLIATGAGIAGAALLTYAYITDQNAKNAAVAAETQKAFADAIRDAGDAAEGTRSAIANAVRDTPALAEALDAAGASSLDLSTAIRGSDEDFEAFKQRLLEAADAANLGNDANAVVAIGLDGLRDSAQGAAEQVDVEGRVVEDAGDKAATAAPKAEDLADALDDDEQAAKDAAESVDQFREAVEKALAPLDQEERFDDLAQTLADLATGIEERAEAVADARERLAEERAKTGDARDTDAIAEAEQELADAIAATTLSTEGNSDAARRNREELRELVDKTAEVIEGAREQGASLEDLQYLRGLEVESLRTQLTEMGYTRAEVDRYIERIEAIPLTKATTLNVETAAAEIKLKAALDRMQREIDENPLSVDVLIEERNVIRNSGKNPPENAAGGAIFDGLFSVGETGRELLRKDGANLEVIAGSPRALGGAGMTNYFTIVAPDVDNGMAAATKRLRVLALEASSNA